MNKLEALGIIKQQLEDHTFIVCNGMIGRELYSLGDSDNRFYMIGSMGIAGAIALGLSHTRPGQKIALIEGDGNTLMGLGSLAQIGARQPEPFVHLCLDNGTHASTGDQHTLSDKVKLENIAQSAGYAFAARCNTTAELESALSQARNTKGPCFILAKVDPGTVPGVPRVEVEPPELTRRFRAHLGVQNP